MKFPVKGTMMVMLCFIVLQSAGQTTVIGKQWPDLEFKEVLNYPKSEMKLSDFEGKPVIIHFWSKSCPPCIAAFPKLERLQEEFGDKIQILLVNDIDKAATEKFFVDKKTINRPRLPMLTAQRNLFNQFRLIGDVWLDGARTIRYASTSYNINSKNLNDFVKGEDVAITQWRLLDDFNPDVPLIAEGNGRWMDSVKQYTYIFRNGFKIIGARDYDPWMPDHQPNRIAMNYVAPRTLYTMAFNEHRKYDYDIIYELKDSSKFFTPKQDELKDKWDRENRYSFDLMVPMDKADQLYKYMRQDLERYFGVKGTIEKRRIKVLVLELNDGGEKLKTNGQKQRRSNYRDSAIFFYNCPFKEVIEFLKEFSKYNLSMPFKDETGLVSNVDVVFNKEAIETAKLDAINKELGNYGLRLVNKMSEKVVLVLRDRL